MKTSYFYMVKFKGKLKFLDHILEGPDSSLHYTGVFGKIVS